MSIGKPKFNLNLNETNSLGFTLTIEGSSSDVDATKPEFRFVLAESNGGKAWLYPMARDEEGDVVVNIPSEEFFSEEKEYQGQVEVILGNHYFVPTTVDIEFTRPLKIEAAVSAKKSSMFKEQKSENKPLNVSSVTVKSKNKIKKETIDKRSQNNQKSSHIDNIKSENQKRKWEELTKEEQDKIKNVLRERKFAKLRKVKIAEAKKQKEMEQKRKLSQKKAEKSVKDKLKSVMASSLLEE